MPELDDLIAMDAVLADLAVTNKKMLFTALGTAAARAYGVDAATATERLHERERLGSTGFGGGVAIPHGKVDGLTRVVGVVARLATPIDFGAVDEMPVDLVVMLLSPIDAGAAHLKALARISRALRDASFVAKLRGAASSDALAALFASDETRDAA